jgi:hypothetical protein
MCFKVECYNPELYYFFFTFKGFKINTSIVELLLNSEQNPEVCDATKADSSNAAWYITHPIFFNKRISLNSPLQGGDVSERKTICFQPFYYLNESLT